MSYASSPYPFEVLVTIKGNPPEREDEEFSITVVDSHVSCDCEHHEQCGEICENLPQVDGTGGNPLLGNPPPKDLAEVYGIALQSILETIAIDIESGSAPPFVEEEI